MKKNLFILLLCCSFQLAAQKGEYGVAGIVQDKANKQPVEFATVELLRPADSSVIITAITDRRGRFSFEKIGKGNYILRSSFIGYAITFFPVSTDQPKQTGIVLEISVQAKDMNEVTVTSQRSLLNTSIDRKIYNVSQDIMAQSGSASDILKNIPSIEVDMEGVVSLRGSSGVMILINGRNSPLMGRTQAEVLQQLPANSIERIEVITNPSAKYRPDGTSGIINIVLKKNTRVGWNGTATVTIGNKDRYTTGISLNYKPGKLNFFGNYNIRRDNRIRTNTINREYFDLSGNTKSYYTEMTPSFARPFANMLGTGFDYTPDEQNSLGISFNYYHRKMTRTESADRFFYDPAYLLTAHFNRFRYEPEMESETDGTIYWQHNFKEEGHELRTELTLSSSTEKEDSRYTNTWLFPAQPSSFDNILQQDNERTQEVVIEYSRPLSEKAKLEAGYEGLFSQLSISIGSEYYDTTTKQFVPDIGRSSLFRYKESTHALYGVYQHSFEKFGFSLGLRAEQTLIDVNMVSQNAAAKNNYFKVYPTVHLSYQFEKGELQLNYSKRVNRPDGDELSPFYEYRDPYTLQGGNPQLLPEVIHSFELGYKIQQEKFSFVPSFYYRYKVNGFTSVATALNDSVVVVTDQNLSKDHSAGLELIFSAKPAKFISLNLSSNFFYTRLDAGNLGFVNNRSIVSMSSQFSSGFTITPNTMAQLSCNYRSARLTAQGRSYASFVANIGFRQDLLKKKLSLVLTISDIFKTMRSKNELNTAGLKQVSIGRRDAGVIYLGISYRFGKALKKQNEEKMEFDDNL